MLRSAVVLRVVSVLALLGLAAPLACFPGDSTGVLGLAAVALTGLVTIALVGACGTRRFDDGHSRLQARSSSLRRRALRSLFVPLRDPDAAGRPRPRAPSLAIPAT